MFYHLRFKSLLILVSQKDALGFWSLHRALRNSLSRDSLHEERSFFTNFARKKRHYKKKLSPYALVRIPTRTIYIPLREVIGNRAYARSRLRVRSNSTYIPISFTTSFRASRRRHQFAVQSIDYNVYAINDD